MKRFLLLIILIIPFSSAISFSPTSLNFALDKEEIACKEIKFDIEFHSEVHDSWSESTSASNTITELKSSPQELQLQTSYPAQIYPEQETLQFCVSGKKEGTYNGALIIRQKETGNSIMQFAVWLKVTINNNKDDRSIKSKKADGGDTSGITWTSQSYPRSPNQSKQLNFNPPDKEIKLSAPSIQNVENKNAYLIASATLIFSLVLFMIVIRFR